MPALLTIVLIINVIVIVAMVFPLLNSDSLYEQTFHRVTRGLLRAMLIGGAYLMGLTGIEEETGHCSWCTAASLCSHLTSDIGIFSK